MHWPSVLEVSGSILARGENFSWFGHAPLAGTMLIRYKKDRIALEIVQRRATKLVYSCKNFSYSKRLGKSGLPTLEYRRIRAGVTQVYKILNDIDMVDKDKLFELATYRQTRGHPLKLYKERSRLNVRANTS